MLSLFLSLSSLLLASVSEDIFGGEIDLVAEKSVECKKFLQANQKPLAAASEMNKYRWELFIYSANLNTVVFFSDIFSNKRYLIKF